MLVPSKVNPSRISLMRLQKDIQNRRARLTVCKVRAEKSEARATRDNSIHGASQMVEIDTTQLVVTRWTRSSVDCASRRHNLKHSHSIEVCTRLYQYLLLESCRNNSFLKGERTLTEPLYPSVKRCNVLDRVKKIQTVNQNCSATSRHTNANT